MSDERFHELLWSPEDGTLSAEEMAEGWHWCGEFDGMLVGPDQWGVAVCDCLEVANA